MPYEATDAVLDAISNINKLLTWLDALLRPLANLAMRLSRLTIIGEEVAVDVIKVALLFVGSAIPILIRVFDFFALRVVVPK